MFIVEWKTPRRLFAISKIDPKLCVIAAVSDTKAWYSAIARIDRRDKLRAVTGDISLHLLTFQSIALAQILAQSNVEYQLILPPGERKPMWRNGRRNGLKIRSGESRVWVRIPSSAPPQKAVIRGKLVRDRDHCLLRRVTHQTARNRRLFANYSSTSRAASSAFLGLCCNSADASGSPTANGPQ
jgi:hypothetical protein